MTKEETKCTCKEHDPYCCQVHGTCPTCVKQEKLKTNLERLPFPELVKEFAEYYKKVPLVEESKQETLKEAAENYAEIYRCPATNYNEYCKHDIISAINFGAKWQAERMYSEEEVLDLLAKFRRENRGKDFIPFKDIQEWFEQFKKDKL